MREAGSLFGRARYMSWNESSIGDEGGRGRRKRLGSGPSRGGEYHHREEKTIPWGRILSQRGVRSGSTPGWDCATDHSQGRWGKDWAGNLGSGGAALLCGTSRHLVSVSGDFSRVGQIKNTQKYKVDRHSCVQFETSMKCLLLNAHDS